MTVIVAVDDTDHVSTVLAQAATLASDLDEPLTVLHVLPRSELVEVLEKEVEGQAPADNYEVQRVGEGIVERAAADLDSIHDPGAIEVEVRVGDPADVIVTYADEVDARYVVIGGRRRSPTGKALFGSVTQRVMLSASVPVLNVPLDER
jgi:nucleotide-binding universal stress UspA family protein